MVAPQAAGRLGVGLLIGHAALDAGKVVLALTGLALCGVDAAVRRVAGELRIGHDDIDADLVMEAQILVYICCSHLACGYGADNGCGAGNAVAAGEYAVHVVYLTAGLGDESAALYGYLALLKAVGLYALTYGYNDYVGGYAYLIAGCLFRAGPAGGVYSAYYLGLCPEGCSAAVFVCLYADGGGKGNELYALGYRALHLFGERGHVGLTAAVYAGYLPCAEADGASAYVHGHVAAAYHDYLLAGKVGQAVVAYGAEHLDGAHHALAVFALYAGLFVGVGAYGYIQCVIFVLKLVEAHVASDGYAGLYFYAGREYGFDLLIQYFPWEAIGGDAVAQHAAQL